MKAATRAWERALSGQDTLLVDAPLGAPPRNVASHRVVRVRCQADPPMGALHQALRLLRRNQDPRPPLEEATSLLRAGLRRRLLGEETPQQAPGARLVEALNQASAGRPTVLVLEHLERADPQTLAWLRRVAGAPGWLTPTLLLQGSDGDGLRSVRDALDEAAVIGELAQAEEPAPEQAPEPASLSPASRTLVHAVGFLPDPFEISDLATLLDESTTRAWVRLQQATEEGLGVMDLGDGRLSIPTEVRGATQAPLLPGLQAHWHRCMAAHRSAEAPVAEAPLATEPPRGARAEPEPDRAAEHLSALGEADRAVEQYQHAARRALSSGLPQRAQALYLAALQQLETLPESGLRQGRVWLELGALAWDSPAAEGFTLQQALEAFVKAQSLLAEADAHTRAELAQHIAGVLHDLGDPASLERGLQALTDGVRALQADGLALEAARLLNDQAAIYLRLGDPVQAAHLLRSSRQVFSERADGDRTAARELAQTDHLLAQLPLHVEARPGQRRDALMAAVQHARDAAGAWQRLGDARELGRVLGTLGSLLAELGQPQQAAELLVQSAQALQQDGDAIGLARTTSRLAELLLAAEQPLEALTWLERSSALNVQKGSVVGIEDNLADLQRAVTGLGPAAQRGAPAERIRRLAGLLEQAHTALTAA